MYSNYLIFNLVLNPDCYLFLQFCYWWFLRRNFFPVILPEICSSCFTLCVLEESQLNHWWFTAWWWFPFSQRWNYTNSSRLMQGMHRFTFSCCVVMHFYAAPLCYDMWIKHRAASFILHSRLTASSWCRLVVTGTRSRMGSCQCKNAG